MQGAHASPDQAWHLAGFGPECVRKACLDEEILDKVLGHSFNQPAEKWLSWWIPLDATAWRYRLSDWSAQIPGLEQWSPNHRYERTGTRSGASVQAFTLSARQILDRVVADLWADGLVEGAPDRW